MTEYEYIFLGLKQANISNLTVEKMIRKYGDIREIINMDLKLLFEDGILKNESVERLYNTLDYNKISKIYEDNYNNGIRFVHMYDEIFPEKLKNIPDMPYCLFYKGRLPSNRPSVAIVGARGASEYGKSISQKLAKELAYNGIEVISGLALGVDKCAHIGAIEGGGDTFAVLACGVDVCYPRSNIETYMSILDNGGVISENPSNTPPLPMYFPIRNRIISGLSDVVIITEAKEKSGSLITVDQALEQSREVYAVPGRISDPLSRGCNELIRQGANILLDINDVFNYLKDLYGKEFKKIRNNKLVLAKEEIIVYSVLDLFPKSLEEIVETTSLDYSVVMRILFDLSGRGIIKETIKNYYVKVI